MACCSRKATRSLKQVRAESARGVKRRNTDFVIRVLPVLCIAAALTSEQLEEEDARPLNGRVAA